MERQSMSRTTLRDLNGWYWGWKGSPRGRAYTKNLIHFIVQQKLTHTVKQLYPNLKKKVLRDTGAVEKIVMCTIN